MPQSLGGVRVSASRQAWPGFFFFLARVFHKMLYTHHISSPDMSSIIHWTGYLPHFPPSSWTAERCNKNQAIKHRNQEPISKERPVPQAYSKQAIHGANVMDLSNPTRTTDTSATPSSMQWPDDHRPHCHALIGSSSENNLLESLDSWLPLHQSEINTTKSWSGQVFTKCL